ncbi:MAG: histidine kinase [Rhodobacteraceae bacterium]|nr:histidine kinase [Paracoccaceae bacterium]
MNGKIAAGFIVVSAMLAGLAIYYMQEYAYYAPVEPASAAAEIRLTALTGAIEVLPTEGFQGIDADSSPLRFRACFTTPISLAMLTETFTEYPAADPLIAPRQFPCFDAARIGADLATGTAVAFLSETNIHPGVDRVVAVYPDGQAFAWQQLNESAEK